MTERTTQVGEPGRWGIYVYNPKCKCDWCSNGGVPTDRWKASGTPGQDSHNPHTPTSTFGPKCE